MGGGDSPAGRSLFIAGMMVLALSAVSSVGWAGTAHAVTGSAYRWGVFAGHQEATEPVAIAGPSPVTALAAANASTMELTASGTVEVWGDGEHDDLGQRKVIVELTSAERVPVPGTVVAIGESMDTDVAVTSTGAVYGWGYDNEGELCLGNTKQKLSPVALPLTGVVMAAGGGGHMEYLLSNGTLAGCGTDRHGQLCDGRTTPTDDTATTPELAMLPAPIASISAGNNTTAALLTDGEVWECGVNNHGQLGNGTLANSDTFTRVRLPGPAASVYAGGDGIHDGSALALLTNGAVYGWGDDNDGQLGNGSTATAVKRPVKASALPSGETWAAVAVGGTTSFVLSSTGDLYDFGNNAEGQAGIGSSEGAVLTPTKILAGVSMVRATSSNVAAYVS